MSVDPEYDPDNGLPVSRVAGAIGRGRIDAADAGISDAYARYLERLAELGAAAGEGPSVQP